MITVAPDEKGLQRAVEAVRAGEVIAYPTETVYGLGVDPFSEAAIERLFDVKGRDRKQPVLVVVSGPEQVEMVAASVSERARAFMDAFWPGPLSLLLPRSPDVPAAVSAGSPKICVRWPGAEVPCALCRLAGHPITSTSANIPGLPPIMQLPDLPLAGVCVGVDGGRLPDSPPSTVYDPETNHIVRQGAVPADKVHALAQRFASA